MIVSYARVYGHAHAAYIAFSVNGHEWIANAGRHAYETVDGLRYGLVRQEVYTFQYGRLDVDAWQEFAYGGNLEEPIATRFFGCGRHLCTFLKLILNFFLQKI